MLIIPRTPSPQPEEPLTERDPNDLTFEEQGEVIRRLQARLTAAEDSQKSLKREQVDDDDPRPRKAARVEAEHVLLVLDDDGSFRESFTASPGDVKQEVAGDGQDQSLRSSSAAPSRRFVKQEVIELD